MDRFVCLLIGMTSGMLTANANSIASECAMNPDSNSAPVIAIEYFEISQEQLTLRYVVKNTTDHVIWICDSVFVEEFTDTPNLWDPNNGFEVFVEKDKKTLLIRRRLDLPVRIWHDFPVLIKGRFIRLDQDQERTHSIAVPLPVREREIFGGESTFDWAVAHELAIEIGYCDVDLPRHIERVVAVAELLACENTPPYDQDSALLGEYSDILQAYFPGIGVAASADSISGYIESHDNIGGEIILNNSVSRLLRKNRFLRHTITGLNIP